MSSPAVVLVTCPQESAKKIAFHLVDEKLAACVNVLPNISSIYYYEGKLFDENEELMIIKTDLALFEQLSTRIKELHSYDIPEIICLPIEKVEKAYLDWINSSLKKI